MRRTIPTLLLALGLIATSAPVRAQQAAPKPQAEQAQPAEATPESAAEPAQADAEATTPEPTQAAPDAAGDSPAAPQAPPGDDDEPATADPEGSEPEAAEPEQAEPEEAEPEPPAKTAPTVLVPRTACDGKKIKAIEVEGQGRVTRDDVLATMKLRVGVPCSDTEVASDAKALWDLGFFKDLIFSVEPEGNQVTLIVTLRERPSIAEITFEGNDAVSDEDIEEALELRAGTILSENAVRQQVAKIRDVYAEEGYFLAEVQYVLDKRPNNEVEVRYEIDEGPEVRVRRLRFVGNDNLSDDELGAFMQTGATGFLSFLSSNDAFKQATFDEDVLRLQALYYDRGYLNVQVSSPRVELTPDRAHIDITIPVQEGPRYKIGRLKVIEYDEKGQESKPLGGRRVVREMIKTDPGEWFSRTVLGEAIERITRHYRDAGYAKVQVEPQTNLENGRDIVHLTVAVKRGPPVHIERIHIQGNDKTRDKVIRREILIAEGDEYDQTLLEASKNRIQALGYFERVDMSEADGDDPDGLIITFEVQERATGTFQVGAGFSSIEQFILTAQIQQQNLFGHGQSLSLNAQISGIRQLVDVSLIEPYFLDTFWSASVNLFITQQNLADFVQRERGGGFSFGHPVFNRNLRLTARYRGRMVRLSTSTGGIFAGGNTNVQGARLNARDTIFADEQLDGFTSSVRFALSWDSRDNRIFPSRGIFASVSAEIASKVLGSERVFDRFRYFGRFYYPIIGGLVFKLNTEAGAVQARSDKGVPLFERFRLGGILSVRGFPFNSLGPTGNAARALDPTLSAGGRGQLLGGNIMLRANAELEMPIVEAVGIRALVFADAGNVFNTEPKFCTELGQASLRDEAADPCSMVDKFEVPLRYSVGFGFRWFSPLGPLRFEWGIPINKRSFEQAVRFEFTIGNFF